MTCAVTLSTSIPNSWQFIAVCRTCLLMSIQQKHYQRNNLYLFNGIPSCCLVGFFSLSTVVLLLFISFLFHLVVCNSLVKQEIMLAGWRKGGRA